MDVRQLQNVLSVIEHGSLGRAAQAMNVSQPALTKSIQRLEERLGVSLFTRDSKGMRPTTYAEALRPHAHGISAGVEQALQEIEAMKSGSRGTVRIAAGPLMTSEILSTAIVALLQQKPSIHVSIHTAIADHIPALLAGQYDFILAQLPLGPHPTGLVYRELVHDAISVIARRGHPLTRRAKVVTADLLKYRWVLPEAGHGHLQRLLRIFESENLPMPVPDIECSSTEFIKSVVGRSDHLGLIAKMGVTRDRSARTVEVALGSPFTARPIGIVWRQNQVLSAPSQMLISLIEAACENNG